MLQILKPYKTLDRVVMGGYISNTLYIYIYIKADIQHNMDVSHESRTACSLSLL